MSIVVKSGARGRTYARLTAMCLASFGAVLVAVTLGCDAAPESAPTAGDGASDGVESVIQDASDPGGVDSFGEGDASGAADSHTGGEGPDSDSLAPPGAGLGPMADPQSAAWANRAHSTQVPPGVGLSFAPADPEPPAEDPPAEDPPAEDPPAEEPPAVPLCIRSADCVDGEFSTGDFCAPSAPGAGEDGCVQITSSGCPFPLTPVCETWLSVDPIAEGLDPEGGPYVACAMRWIFDEAYVPYVAPDPEHNFQGSASFWWTYDSSDLEFVAALPPACSGNACGLPVGFPAAANAKAQLASGWSIDIDGPTFVDASEDTANTKSAGLALTSDTIGPAPLLAAYFDAASNQIVGDPEWLRLVFRPTASDESGVGDQTGFPGVCTTSVSAAYEEDYPGPPTATFFGCYSSTLSVSVLYRAGAMSPLCPDADNDGVDNEDDCHASSGTTGGILGEICGNYADDTCDGVKDEGCNGVCARHVQCQLPTATNGFCDPTNEAADEHGCMTLPSSADLSCESPDQPLCKYLQPLDNVDGGPAGMPLFACPLNISDKGEGLTDAHNVHLEVDLPQDDWTWVGVYKRNCTKPWCQFEPVFTADSGQAESVALRDGILLMPNPASLAEWGAGELVSLDVVSADLATGDPTGTGGVTAPWAPQIGGSSEVFALLVTPTTWPPPAWHPPCVRGATAHDANGQPMTVKWSPSVMTVAPTPVCQPPVCNGASCPAGLAEYATPCGVDKVCAAGSCKPVDGCQTDSDCEDADMSSQGVCDLPAPGSGGPSECVQEPWLTPYCPAGSVPLCTSFEPFDATSTSFAAGDYLLCTLRMAAEMSSSSDWNGDVPGAFQMDIDLPATEWEFVNMVAELCFGPMCFWAPVGFPEDDWPESALPSGFVISASPSSASEWAPGTSSRIIVFNYTNPSTPLTNAAWDPQTQSLTGDPTILSLLYRNPGSSETAPPPPCVSNYLHSSGKAHTVYTQWLPDYGLFVLKL